MDIVKVGRMLKGNTQFVLLHQFAQYLKSEKIGIKMVTIVALKRVQELLKSNLKRRLEKQRTICSLF